MKDSRRESGKISYVQSGPEDHGILTVSVGIEFNGSAQSFGGLALDKQSMKWFLNELCETFGVRDPEALVGMKCYALRCFDTWNEPIEGLENMDGQRFTITGFRKRHYPEHAQDRLERKRKELESDIGWATKRGEDARRRLDTIDSEFTDWEPKPPKSKSRS